MRLLFIAFLLCFFVGNAAVYAQNTKGIGIGFNRDVATGMDTVSIVYAGNAGADAGLRVGDGLLAVGSTDLSKLSKEEVIALLKGGPGGAAYTLRIKRKIQTTLGEKVKEMELQITPREVALKTCLSGDCKNGTGNLIDNASGTRMEGTFREGRLVQGKAYYKSGRLWLEGTFKDGRLDGKGVDYYDESGSLVASKGRFEAGILKAGSFYSADGKTVQEGTFDEKGALHGDNCSFKIPGYSYKGRMEHGKMAKKGR